MKLFSKKDSPSPEVETKAEAQAVNKAIIQEVEGPYTGKKYSFEYDEGDAKGLIKVILNDEDLPNLQHISVGSWGSPFEESPQIILDQMVQNRDRLQHISSLFVGDMDYEDCEVSWINQGNYKELLEVFPNLKVLKIKGSEGLILGESITHSSLEELEIICGGLPANIPQELKSAHFPNLKKLVLYVGISDYGLDCTISDIVALADKNLFPALTYLGITDSEEEDDVLKLLLDSNILPQLSNLDISFGCLTDVGGQMLIDNISKLAHLKKIHACYHYMSEEMMDKLTSLPVEIDVSDPQGPDEEYMYPMITE